MTWSDIHIYLAGYCWLYQGVGRHASWSATGVLPKGGSIFQMRETVQRISDLNAPSAKAHSTETWSRLREELRAGHYVCVWTRALADVPVHDNKTPMLQSEAPARRTLLIDFELLGWRKHTRSCNTTSLVWIALICVFLGHERLRRCILLPWLSKTLFCLANFVHALVKGLLVAGMSKVNKPIISSTMSLFVFFSRCFDCWLLFYVFSDIPAAYLGSLATLSSKSPEAAATHQCYGGSTALAVNGAFGVQTTGAKDFTLWRSSTWAAWSLGLASHTLAESGPITQRLWSPGNSSLWGARTKAALATCQRRCRPRLQAVYGGIGSQLFTTFTADPAWQFPGSLRCLCAQNHFQTLVKHRPSGIWTAVWLGSHVVQWRHAICWRLWRDSARPFNGQDIKTKSCEGGRFHWSPGFARSLSGGCHVVVGSPANFSTQEHGRPWPLDQTHHWSTHRFGTATWVQFLLWWLWATVRLHAFGGHCCSPDPLLWWSNSGLQPFAQGNPSKPDPEPHRITQASKCEPSVPRQGPATRPTLRCPSATQGWHWSRGPSDAIDQSWRCLCIDWAPMASCSPGLESETTLAGLRCESRGSTSDGMAVTASCSGSCFGHVAASHWWAPCLVSQLIRTAVHCKDCVSAFWGHDGSGFSHTSWILWTSPGTGCASHFSISPSFYQRRCDGPVWIEALCGSDRLGSWESISQWRGCGDGVPGLPWSCHCWHCRCNASRSRHGTWPRLVRLVRLVMCWILALAQLIPKLSGSGVGPQRIHTYSIVYLLLWISVIWYYNRWWDTISHLSPISHFSPADRQYVSGANPFEVDCTLLDRLFFEGLFFQLSIRISREKVGDGPSKEPTIVCLVAFGWLMLNLYCVWFAC